MARSSWRLSGPSSNPRYQCWSLGLLYYLSTNVSMVIFLYCVKPFYTARSWRSLPVPSSSNLTQYCEVAAFTQFGSDAFTCFNFPSFPRCLSHWILEYMSMSTFVFSFQSRDSTSLLLLSTWSPSSRLVSMVLWVAINRFLFQPSIIVKHTLMASNMCLIAECPSDIVLLVWLSSPEYMTTLIYVRKTFSNWYPALSLSSRSISYAVKRKIYSF